MSLAAALKKGQAAMDTLGSWDPFQEPAGESAAPAKLPAARPARPVRASAGSDRAVPANVNAAAERAASGSQGRPQGQLRAVPDMDELADFDRPTARPAQARAAQARAAAPSGKPAARPAASQKSRGKASWLHDGLPQHGRVNAAQYIRELERFAAEESRRAVADTVMDVNPGEIEGVAKLAARIKGRYLAKLLDLGNPTKGTIQDTEVRELTRYRETYEELARGLDMLKVAIEAGDVGVSGMVRR
ncbi:MAG: hypothetical protein RLO51_20545 [Thalassobaculum sp.]|uniref:hypothetical protein n=1 Tax=Thalassobaculum sp. TaxID=2022740 RepID=UPI0032F05A2E